MRLHKLLLFLLLFLTCVCENVSGKSLPQNEIIINIKAEEPLIINFPIIGDGGQWMIDSFDTTMLELVSKNEFHPKVFDTIANMIIFCAGGGTELWTFKIHKKGIIILNFYYKDARPTESMRREIRKIIVD